jgi:hypothetical protein
MSSLADLPELVGFFSYSRRDDEHSSGALSRLRARVYDELRLQLGRDVRLWQDTAAIPHGTLWGDEIKRAIAESAFFIPIVTPSAVTSSHCRTEFELFLAREAELDRKDLIFPILYIRVPALGQEDQRHQNHVLEIIHARQYADWTKLRQHDVASLDVGKQVERLCEDIVEALRHSWLSPEERRKKEEHKKPQHEAEVKPRSEEPRLGEEAIANRRAEEERKSRETETAGRVEEEFRRRQAKSEALAEAQEEKRRHEAETTRCAEQAARRKRDEAEAALNPGNGVKPPTLSNKNPDPLLVGALLFIAAGFLLALAGAHLSDVISEVILHARVDIPPTDLDRPDYAFTAVTILLALAAAIAGWGTVMLKAWAGTLGLALSVIGFLVCVLTILGSVLRYEYFVELASFYSYMFYYLIGQSVFYVFAVASMAAVVFYRRFYLRPDLNQFSICKLVRRACSRSVFNSVTLLFAALTICLFYLFRYNFALKVGEYDVGTYNRAMGNTILWIMVLALMDVMIVGFCSVRFSKQFQPG